MESVGGRSEVTQIHGEDTTPQTLEEFYVEVLADLRKPRPFAKPVATAESSSFLKLALRECDSSGEESYDNGRSFSSQGQSEG